MPTLYTYCLCDNYCIFLFLFMQLNKSTRVLLLNITRFMFTKRHKAPNSPFSLHTTISSESHFTTDNRTDAFREQCRPSRFLLGGALNY